MPTLLLALALSAGLEAPEHGKPKARPPPQPSRVAVPAVKGRPLLSNPQLSLDGKHVYVARLGLPGVPAQGLDVMAIALSPGLAPAPSPTGPPETISFPVPVNGNELKLLVSADGKYLAVLSEGELWIEKLGDTAGPHRLYPPAEGEAPLGPRLSQASFAADSTWLLVESPTGWGRLAVANGQFQSLPLPVVDLTNGCLAMSPDTQHALMAKPQQGEGYLNGSPVLAINITTAFAQGLDSTHLYSEVLFLPDGHALGKDAVGALWLLLPKTRLPYFTPPPAPRHSSVGAYAINFAATRLAWTVTTGLDGHNPHADLWVVQAPPTPEPPKDSQHGED
jgi:hypothetical protein